MSSDYCWPGNCCGGKKCLAPDNGSAGGEMSDIVERLRQYKRPWSQLMDDAADEIEQLRQFEQARKEQGVEIAKLVNELRDARAENERLRALVQALLDNDPDDDAADGVTVLEVWRKEARRALAGEQDAGGANPAPS